MTQPKLTPSDPLDELPPMLSAREVSAFLGIDEGLLAKWRMSRIGPTFVKLTPSRGGAVRYPRESLRAYIAQNTVETVEQATPAVP